MPKVKKRKAIKSKETLSHNDCRLRACIWCGKKKSPGSVRVISHTQLLLIQKHGSPSLDPATDDMLPKVLCSTCRLGLKDFESPPATGIKNHLPTRFEWE